jgi:rhodanese-related sulfurtransferase
MSLLREDLGWAGFILAVAAFFGILQHWTLVQVSLRGELPRHLEESRAQRRAVQFQGVKTVSLDQAHTLWQGGALFLDAREAQEFREIHVPGALNLPPEVLEKEGERALTGVPKDRAIVVYCGQAACDAALKVAEGLQQRGYTQVQAFLGGFQAWDEAGFPAETSQ